MEGGSHGVDEDEEGEEVVRGKSGEQEMLRETRQFEELERVADGGLERENEEEEEGEEIKGVGEATGKLKSGDEKKLKWKIEMMEKERVQGEVEEEERVQGEVEEKEREQGEVEEETSTHCTNQISLAKQDMSRVNMLPAAEGQERKVDLAKQLGWREALAVDPLLANLHIQLDQIFFPKAKVCQVPLDM